MATKQDSRWLSSRSKLPCQRTIGIFNLSTAAKPRLMRQLTSGKSRPSRFMIFRKQVCWPITRRTWRSTSLLCFSRFRHGLGKRLLRHSARATLHRLGGAPHVSLSGSGGVCGLCWKQYIASLPSHPDRLFSINHQLHLHNNIRLRNPFKLYIQPSTHQLSKCSASVRFPPH